MGINVVQWVGKKPTVPDTWVLLRNLLLTYYFPLGKSFHSLFSVRFYTMARSKIIFATETVLYHCSTIEFDTWECLSSKTSIIHRLSMIFRTLLYEEVGSLAAS